MADISKVKLPNGTTYNIKDTVSGYTKNTGTVTSVGLSNATNSGLSITGSPITSSGSITVGHSNVLSSAQSTQAVYPVTIDKNGHIASYGTAVTIPTVTSSYSSTGTNAVNGIAVNAALQTLDSSISSTTGQAISAITITDGKIASSSKISVGETNQNAFSNVKVGSTTIAADSKTDTLELVAGTNITLTPDATNDTITISSTGGGGGGSYTATSPVDITNNVISLEDSYGDIKNPYGAKNEHYVLAGGSSTIASFDDVVMPINPTGGMQEITTEAIVLPAGTYTYSLHCVAPATSISKGINLVYYNGSYYYYVATLSSTTDAIDADLSGEITLSTTTSVNLYIRISANSYYYPILNATFTNIMLSSSAPSVPEFRALTNDDLPAIGNIQNTGALQTTDVTIATGDKLVVTDASDSNKVARASISFDTTNTTAYLRKDGTWATPSGGGGDAYRITLSHNSSTDEYSIDRTYAEVEAAVRANKFVYIYDYTLTVSSAYQNSTIIAPFTCMCPSEDWFEFYATIANSNYENSLIRYTLADDGVYVDEFSLAPELPSVNTSDNGKVLKVVNGAWSAATSSSSGGLFLVNFSLRATLGSYTADKSFAQIVSAVDSGSVVMGQYRGEYFSLTYFSEGDEQTDGDVRFERYSNNLMSMEWFGMDSQGQVTYGNESPWETYTDEAIGNAIAALY